MNVPTTELPFWRRRAWLGQTGRSGLAIYLAAVLGFLTNLLVARALGPQNFGAVVLALTTVAFLAAALDFSLEEAVVHHGARALERDPGGLRGLIRISMRIDMAVGVGVFLIVLVTAPAVASFVSDGRLAPILLVLAGLEVLVTTANGTTGAVLLLSGRPELRAWALAWTAALRLVAVLVAIHVFGGGAERILLGYAVGAGIGSAAQYLVARRTERRAWGAVAPARAPVRPAALVSFGLHSSATTTIIAVRAALVTVVLGRGSGPVQVGFLAIAMLPVSLAEVATSPVRTTVFAEQAKLAAAGRLDVLWRAVRGYTAWALVVGIPAAAVGYVVLPWLLPWLYGDGFSEAVKASRILLPAAVATLAVAWAKGLPASIGKPQVRTVVSCVELAATFVAVIALASRGANGVAAALSIVAVVVASLWWWVARRMLAAGGGATGRGEERAGGG
jgi:O-antigen/teichoic acid export membrane protein